MAQPPNDSVDTKQADKLAKDAKDVDKSIVESRTVADLKDRVEELDQLLDGD